MNLCDPLKCHPKILFSLHLPSLLMYSLLTSHYAPPQPTSIGRRYLLWEPSISFHSILFNLLPKIYPKECNINIFEQSSAKASSFKPKKIDNLLQLYEDARSSSDEVHAVENDRFCKGPRYEDDHSYGGSHVFPPYVESAKPFNWTCHKKMMDLIDFKQEKGELKKDFFMKLIAVTGDMDDNIVIRAFKEAISLKEHDFFKYMIWESVSTKSQLISRCERFLEKEKYQKARDGKIVALKKAEKLRKKKAYTPLTLSCEEPLNAIKGKRILCRPSQWDKADLQDKTTYYKAVFQDKTTYYKFHRQPRHSTEECCSSKGR